MHHPKNSHLIFNYIHLCKFKLCALFFGIIILVQGQNVGIGTVTPLSKLHVVGAIRSDTLVYIGPGVRTLFATPGGVIYDSLVLPSAVSWEINGNSNIGPTNFLGTTNANDLIFKTNNTEWMRILANGNIGIGTASPAQKLHLVNGLIRIDGSTNAINNMAFITFGLNNGTALGYIGDGASGDNDSYLYSYNNNVRLGTGLAGSAANSLFLTQLGNVGIGNLAPANKLEITSAAANTSGLRFTNLTSASTTVAANGKSLSVDANGDVILTPSATDAWSILGNTGTIAGTNFFGTTDAQDLVFKTNNTEKMRILASGSVGIGTTTPLTKLHVSQGNARITNNNFAVYSSLSYGALGHPVFMGAAGGGTESAPTYPLSGATLSSFIGRDVLDYSTSNYGGASIYMKTTENFSSTNKGTNIIFSTTPNGSNTITQRAIIDQNGNFGIGTAVPNNKLEITSAAANTSGLRFTNLTSTSATVAANGNYLSVNATGDVILTPAPAGSGPSNDWSLSGNAGTTAGTNFIGTTDFEDLVFKRNNVVAGLIGISNTSFGESALLTGTGFFNSAFGKNALRNNTSGSSLVAIGYSALAANTSGGGNVAVGNNSLFSNTTGGYNIGVGASTLNDNTTGNGNIAMGNSSLQRNTIGTYNTSIGYASLIDNTTGSRNISIGYVSLYKNTTASYNISIGNLSMYNNTTGASNLSIGETALYNNISGQNNIVYGHSAMYSNTIGSYNSAFGSGSLRTVTTGSSNIGIGQDAGASLNTGNSNIFIGNYSGFSSVTSGNNNIIVGNSSGVPLAAGNNQLNIGDIIYGTNIYSLVSGRIGILTNTPTSALSVNGTADKVGGGAWGTYSDARVKKNVVNYTKGLKEILQIRPVSFQYNGKGTYTEDGKTYVGVIAQEIEDVLPSTVTKTKLGEFDDLRQYDSSELLYTLINAVKEQQQLIQQQQKELKTQQEQNEKQQKQIELQEKAIHELQKK